MRNPTGFRIPAKGRNPTGFRILAKGWDNPWSGMVYLDKPEGLAEEGGGSQLPTLQNTFGVRSMVGEGTQGCANPGLEYEIPLGFFDRSFADGWDSHPCWREVFHVRCRVFVSG